MARTRPPPTSIPRSSVVPSRLARRIAPPRRKTSPSRFRRAAHRPCTRSSFRSQRRRPASGPLALLSELHVSSLRTSMAAALLAALSLPAAASCGSAFCLVNTDWSVQGTWVDTGVRGDLRFEYIDLDQPRTGTHNVGVGEIPRHHDEVETRNRNLVATFDWGLSPQWGVNLVIPYVDRYHLHIHNHQGEQIPETWDFRALGDVRVQARYQAFTRLDDPNAIQSAGAILGLKLPTGRFDVTNGEGEEAERTLQPGTGTTDLVLGGYWHSDYMSGHSLFASAQVLLPANERAGFKPGKRLQLDLGYRKAVGADLGLLLQLNYLAKGRDSGENAEPEDSGQRMVYLSPGITYNVGHDAQVYAFVQAPLYQSVNGVQLVADWSAAAGVSWRF